MLISTQNIRRWAVLSLLAGSPLLVQPGHAQVLAFAGTPVAPGRLPAAPPQPTTQVQLRDALLDLMKRHHIEILFDEILLANKWVQPASMTTDGTPEKALTQLLLNTGLQYRRQRKGAYLIVPDRKAKRASTESLPVPTQAILPRFETKPGQETTSNINSLPAIAPTMAAQEIPVRGVVKASDNGQGLPGVTILIKGTTRGTVTDATGSFQLTVPDNNAVLVFSFVGYDRQEVRLGAQKEINITLAASLGSLEEVVVVGYGTQNRRDVTGAVSTVKAADLERVNAVSVDNLLQGKAAGLNIVAYNAQPGGNLAVNIRGALSPRGDNSPLYVIDGLPLTSNFSLETTSSTSDFRGNVDRSPLNSINPNDIESIDILKDASATAIYGSAAANGVILITTKKGKEGKTTVNYSGSYSIQTPQKFLEPLNATEFMTNSVLFSRERFLFNNKIAPYGNVDPSTKPAFQPFFSSDDIAKAGIGTNYVDYVVRPGRINDQNISISGGTASTKIFTSVNFFDQQALLRNSNFKRITGRINIDQKLGSRVNLSLGMTYSQINNDNVPTGRVDDADSPSLILTALAFAPTFTPRDANGVLSRSYYARTPNPASYDMVTNKTMSRRLLITPNLQVNIMDGLRLNLTGGIDQNSSERSFFVPVGAMFQSVPEGNGQYGVANSNNYSAESFLTYDKAMGKSRFSAVAGVGYYKTEYNGYGLSGVGFNTDAFGIDNLGIAYNRDLGYIYSGRSERSKLSQFVRLNYTFMDRYILQFTGRRDGTSNFPTGKKYGAFPGISAAWLINEENFMKGMPALSQLKLRAGYGTSGNESITAQNNYSLSLYSLSNNYQYLIGNTLRNTGLLQTQIGNPDLRWETNITINAGLDFGFFNNRLSGSLDYFNRTAKDLLDFRALPSANPIGGQAANIGSTRSTGFEFTLRSQNVTKKYFSWSSLLTLGSFRTTWVERNPEVKLADYIGLKDPMNAFYGWKTDGLIRSQADIPAYQKGAALGNIRYVDHNGDGKLDIGDVVKLGNFDPKISFGLGNNFTFKGFDLDFFVYGNYGGITFDGYQSLARVGLLSQPGAPGNSERSALNVYTTFNQNGIYPGFSADAAATNNPTRSNDYRMVRNSYFLRLKNITLGYTIPASVFGGQKFVRSARVFANAQNLGFISNIRGFDPEMERNNSPYPTALTTAFGVNIQF